MYVRWKTLIGLGVLFWLSLCVYDAYFSDLSYRYNEFDSTWLNEVPQEEILLGTSSEVREDDIQFPLDGFYFRGGTFIFWNFLTFGVTIFVFGGGKNVFKRYLLKIRERYTKTKTAGETLQQAEEFQEFENAIKKSGSRIPIPINFRSSSTNLEAQNSGTSLLSASGISLESNFKSFTMRGDGSFTSEQPPVNEQHNARLREEIITLQEKSMKETFSLTRKIDALNKEKREINRQLTIANKENRGAKQQLEELLAERSMFIERLDTATREFKTNTKSKKIALAKLEEAQGMIATLRLEKEKVAHEKTDLENKYNHLEQEHVIVQDRLSLLENCSKRKNSSPSRQENFEISKLLPKLGLHIEPRQKLDLQDIAQSHKDVQKVQERLQNLEKSLDRLKILNYDRKTSEPTISNTTNDNSVQSPLVLDQTCMELLTGRNEEEQEGSKHKLGNLTDEQRLKPLEEPNISGDESPPCFAKQHQLADPFERVGLLIKSVKNSDTPINYKFDVNYVNELATSASENEKSTDQVDDDDSDEWENASTEKCRMVSNSPAFQRFLKNMEPFEKGPVSPGGKTHIIF